MNEDLLRLRERVLAEQVMTDLEQIRLDAQRTREHARGIDQRLKSVELLLLLIFCAIVLKGHC